MVDDDPASEVDANRHPLLYAGQKTEILRIIQAP